MAYVLFLHSERQNGNVRIQIKKEQNWISYPPKVERMKGRLSSSFVNMSCAMMHVCMMTIKYKYKK